MANTEIKLSSRNMKIVGTLSEMNLVREEREITLEGGKKVKGEAIHAPLGQPAMIIDVNGSPVPVSLMWTNSITKDGKPNSKFKAMETIMEQYVPKTKATEDNPATKLCVTGMLGLNEYAKSETEWSSRFELSGTQCTRNTKDEEDQAEMELTGVVKSIVPEKDKEGMETGRMIMEIFTFVKEEGKVVIQPQKVFVEEDLVDDFQGFYEKGQTVKIYLGVKVIQVGAKENEVKTGFGRKAKVQKGFTITELVLIGGEEPEEEEEKQYKMEDVKLLLDERDIMIKSKQAEKAERDKTPKSSTSSPKKGLGRQASIPVTNVEDDDLPF